VFFVCLLLVSVSLEKGRLAFCLSNLKEVNLAVIKFVTNNGEYPESLLELYPEFIDKRILICPSDKSTYVTDQNYSSYLYSKPVGNPVEGQILIQERQGIHRQIGFLKPLCHVVYADKQLTNIPIQTRIYIDALEKLSAGKQKDAEAIFDHTSRLYPDSQRLLFARAVCARSRWAKHLSTPWMEKVVQIDSTSVEGQCANYVLNLHFRTDPVSVAINIKSLSSLVDKNPRNPLILWSLAIECHQHFKNTGEHTYSEKGAESYRKLREKWKVAPVLVHQTYANILSEELGQHEQALEHRRLAIQLEPAAWTYEGLGNTLVKLKRYEEANSAFVNCTELDPQDAHYWMDWALCFEAQDKYDECVVKLQKAAELNPEEPNVWRVWGRSLSILDRLEEAVTKYEQHMRYHPDDKNVRHQLELCRVLLQRQRENPGKEVTTSNNAAIAEIKSGSHAKLLEWYLKAAEQGDADAQNNLGYYYDKGLGITQDYTHAIKWYRKAAEQGDAYGQANLGNMYEAGCGVKKDYTQAVEWYRKSAEQGNAKGQSHLGWMYLKGLGVAQDYVVTVRIKFTQGRAVQNHPPG